MKTNPDFERLLDEEPWDWTSRKVYADWLEENGERKFAELQRWLAEHKICAVPVETLSGEKRWLSPLPFWLSKKAGDQSTHQSAISLRYPIEKGLYEFALADKQFFQHIMKFKSSAPQKVG